MKRLRTYWAGIYPLVQLMLFVMLVSGLIGGLLTRDSDRAATWLAIAAISVVAFIIVSVLAPKKHADNNHDKPTT